MSTTASAHTASIIESLDRYGEWMSMTRYGMPAGEHECSQCNDTGEFRYWERAQGIDHGCCDCCEIGRAAQRAEDEARYS